MYSMQSAYTFFYHYRVSLDNVKGKLPPRENILSFSHNNHVYDML